MLVESDGVVQLVDALERHDRAEELDQVARPRNLDPEVRPAEAEYHARLVLVEQRRIDHDPALGAEQRDDERERHPPRRTRPTRYAPLFR